MQSLATVIQEKRNFNVTNQVPWNCQRKQVVSLIIEVGSGNGDVSTSPAKSYLYTLILATSSNKTSLKEVKEN